MRILFATTPDQAHAATPQTRNLTAVKPPANLPAGDARRDSWEGSAFWPELNPRTRDELIAKGYGEEVAAARAIAPELSLAISKGFPIPEPLKARAVYETYKIMLSGSRTEKLRAVEVLERMVRATANPNALPDQLAPAAGPTTNVQVNIQNGPAAIAAESTTVSVAELVDEMLSRADVQAAIEAEVPHTDEDYGM